jgi:hypothetical protein
MVPLATAGWMVPLATAFFTATRKRPACDVLHRRVELSRLRTMVGSPVRVCAAAEERADDAGRNCMLLRLRRIQ